MGYAQFRYEVSSKQHGHLFIGYIDTSRAYTPYINIYSTQTKITYERTHCVMITMPGYGSLFATPLGAPKGLHCTDGQQGQPWFTTVRWNGCPVVQTRWMMAGISRNDVHRLSDLCCRTWPITNR